MFLANRKFYLVCFTVIILGLYWVVCLDRRKMSVDGPDLAVLSIRQSQ